MPVAASSHFAKWRSLETRLDRWTSLLALGVGVAACVAFAVL